MRQSEALAILNAGANVFLTGAPGAGKTYVLNEFIRQARADGANVAVTASTGIAATHIDGQTIHSWSGVGLANVLTPNLLKTIKTRRRRKIQAADVLIIDEVSMMHAWLLRHGRFRCAVKCGNDPRPFGGIASGYCPATSPAAAGLRVRARTATCCRPARISWRPVNGTRRPDSIRKDSSPNRWCGANSRRSSAI